MKAIMYHYVRPFDSEYPYLKNLDINNFKKQLDFFEQEYGFLTKEEFIDSFKTGNTKKGIVLTFDDGLHCHYNYVFKELKKRNLWGVFYISTQPYTKHTLLNVHKIHLLLGKNKPEKLIDYLNEIINDSLFNPIKLKEFQKATYSTQNSDEYTLLFKRILNYYIDIKFKTKVVDHLCDKFLSNSEDLVKSFYLSTEHILEMHNAGMIIGSHTVSHPVMSTLSGQEQELEITLSFNFLKSIIKKFDFKTFCYPYGGFHSFNSKSVDILNRQNCKFSFNVEQRDIESLDLLNKPQALPRYDCNQFKYGQVKTI
jgi:peptidoglycan/xylan/chitin deacetylase (PgdA/CDA1 family)